MVHHSGRITGFSLFAPSGLEVGVKGERGRVRNHRHLSKLNYKNGEKKKQNRKRPNKQAKGKATTACI